MKTFRGWAVTTVFGVFGGLFGDQIAGAHAGVIKQDWHTLVGLVIGEVAAFLVLTLFAYLPQNRNNHWAPTVDRLDSTTPDDHSILILTTQCSHFYKDVECAVTDPAGRKFSATWRSSTNQTQGILDNKAPIMLRYPTNFRAEWPKPGKYRVEWTCGKAKGSRRVTLRRLRWVVTN